VKTAAFIFILLTLYSCNQQLYPVQPKLTLQIAQTPLPKTIDSNCLKTYGYLDVEGKKIPVEVQLENVVSNQQQLKREQKEDTKYAVLTAIWTAFITSLAILVLNQSN
jgi:hypothetical protein